MNCDRLKKIEDLICSAVIQKDVNEYLKMYINSVISRTWDLGNLRKEICLCQESLKSINKYFLLGDKKIIDGLLGNIKFFYDIIIEDFARWTIKKQIFKLLNNCLYNLNANDINRLSNKLYADNSKFYIHKLIDVLSIYGDYDFQAVILEVIFHTSTRHELKYLSKQLIPESEELRKAFSKINTETFHKTSRGFLNSLNEKSNKIFSICCENVTLGSIQCVQDWDEHRGVWVDFNMVDGAISWYVSLKSLKIEDTMQNDKNNFLDLITLFKEDVNNVAIKRFKETVEVSFALKESALSFHNEYQNIIDKELTVRFEIAHSVKTDYLIAIVLTNIFGKTALPNSELNKTDEIIKLRFQKNRLLRKRKISSSSNTSSKPNCRVCLEQRSIPESDQSKGEQMETAQKLGQKIRPRLVEILKDENMNFPVNLSRKESLTDIESEADLLDGRIIEESDIDNMSIHYASQEQLIRMANDFDTAISLIKNGKNSVRRASSAISSIIKTERNLSKKCSSLSHSQNKSSKIQLPEIFEGTSNTSKEKSEIGSVSDIFKFFSQEKCDKETTRLDSRVVASKATGVLENEVEIVSEGLESIGNVQKKTNSSQHWKSGTINKPSSTSTNKEVKSSLIRNTTSKSIKRSKRSKKENVKTKARKTFRVKRITNRNYNVDIKDSIIYASISNFFDMNNENSHFLDSLIKNHSIDSLKKVNRTFPWNMSIERMRGREEVTDNESVGSVRRILNVPEIQRTPPPCLENNSDRSFSSSSPIVRKVKKIKPLPVTPLSEPISKDDLQSREKEIEMSGGVKVKSNDADKITSEGEKIHVLKDKNKIVEKEQIIINSEDRSTDFPIWSRINYISLQSFSLNRDDFLGSYYFVVFYHYDIFASDMEACQEILVLNNRLLEMNNLNTKMLLCYVGNMSNFLKKAATLVEYQNLQLPIIADDGSLVSLFWKNYLENFPVKKSYILVDDKGCVVFKLLCTVGYAIDVDLMLHITRNFQKNSSSSLSRQ